MIRINLLPHRAIRRQALQRQFIWIALGFLVVGAGIWLLVHTMLADRIDNQRHRNQFLSEKIVELDKQIEEIKKLREQTAQLLARKQVVEALQANRAEAVHLLDELVRQLPDGVYLKGIKQVGQRVAINGYAQSNARVSTLMRNLESSPWLEQATLVEIRTAVQNNQRLSEFKLNINIARAKSEDQKPPAVTKASATGAADGDKSLFSEFSTAPSLGG